MSMNNTVLPLYKAQKKKKGNGSGFSLSTLLLLAPLVLVFFVAGLFVGSQFVQSHLTDTVLPSDNPAIRVQPIPSSVLDPLAPSNVAVPPKPAEPVDFAHQPEPPKTVDKFDVHQNYQLIETRLSKYFPAKAGSFMTAQGSFDRENTIVAAWFYMDPADGTGSMKTIFGNKAPGCEKSVAQNGYTVYVNGWETSDQLLYAEWGGRTSGCNKISSQSAGVKVTSGKWHHVALALGSDSVALYLDGEQVAKKVGVDRLEQTRQSLVVGAHANQQYPFVGRLSNLKVLQCSSEPTDADVQVAIDVLESSQSTPCRAVVHYPLNDFDAEGENSQATEMVNARHGKYPTRPQRPSSGAPPEVNAQGFVDGVPNRALTDEIIEESEKLGRERREHVKAAMVHAWEGYKTYAWGRDELRPLSNRGQDNWGGLGVTLVDSLDTLWIMGLKDYFWEACDWVRNSLTFERTGSVSTFETTIRELGGLLGAYDMSNDHAFLEKAIDLGKRLSPAFNTATGIAKSHVNLKTGATGSWSGSSSILAELGSLQLEFCYLSKASGDPSFCEKAMKAFEVLYNNPVPHGLYPTHINPNNGKPANSMVAFGALGDSFYEYLLKVWLQGGRKDNRWREMYDRAVDGVVEKMLQTTTGPEKLLYLGDWDGARVSQRMEHLTCFMPGVLALGAYTDPNGLESPRAQRDLAIAKGLMYTCYQMYARMPTGISPEVVKFVNNKDMAAAPNAPFYILRPETVESMFVLNHLTKEPIYRDWAWEIFEAIEKHCKTATAYGAIPNVQRVGGGVDDRMESFFLGETLKYLYLAMDPDHPIDLMKYVFNTEAHPTRIFE